MGRYVESAVLRIEDDASKTAAKISANLRRFTADARRTASALASIGTGARSLSNNAGATRLADSLKTQNAAARMAASGLATLRSAQNSAAGSGGRLNAVLAQTVSQLRAVAAASRGARIALPTAQAPRRLAPPAQPGGARQAASPWANVGHKFTPNGMALHITAKLATVTASKIEHAAVEGVKENSNARESMYQRGASRDDIDWASGLARKMSSKYVTTSQADTLENLNDISAAVHDREGQASLADLLAKRQQLAVGRGENAAEVRRSNVQIVKTLEMAGALVDGSGHFNADKTERLMNMINSVQAVEGRNIDANQIKQAYKYARENAVTQTPENMRNILFLGAEISGSSAGSGLRGMMSNMTGRATNSALQNMIDNGLATGGLTPKGKFDRSQYKLKDEDLLRTDFGAWQRKHLDPLLQKKGIDPKSDPGKLSNLLNTLFSDPRAKDFAFKWLTQAAENAKKGEAADKVRQSEADALRVPNASVNGAAVAAQKQAENIFGGNVLETGVLAVLNAGRMAIEQVNKALKTKDPHDAVKATGIVGAGAAGIGLAGWAGSKFMNLFNPLNGSAVALNGSAAALSAAAAELSAASGKKALTDAVPGADKADKAGKAGKAAGKLGMFGLGSMFGAGMLAISESLSPENIGRAIAHGNNPTKGVKSNPEDLLPGVKSDEDNAKKPEAKRTPLFGYEGSGALITVQKGFAEGKYTGEGTQNAWKKALGGEDSFSGLKSIMDNASRPFKETFGTLTEAAGKFTGLGDQLKSASSLFESSMSGIGEKVEAGGTAAGSAMQKALESGGAAAAAAIAKAVSNISVNVSGAGKPAAPTGGASPSKG